MVIKKIFEIEKKPRKGLMAFEWAVMAYLLFTLLLIMITYTKLQHPGAMLWGRVQVVISTVALWWDHLFAGYEQQLFHFQPALVFSQVISNPVFSELMHLGYASYYPLIALVSAFYFLYRYQEFARVQFIILGSFMLYYVIFVLLPVTGPQYYYLAAGVDQIAQGHFPNVGDYFLTHSEALTTPGWQDGFFYQCVTSAHDAGERPTAAFPSSHVGVTTILLLLAWHARNRKLLYTMLPFYVLMCFATVYIQAHYAIDVIGGWFSAIIIYTVLFFLSKKFV